MQRDISRIGPRAERYSAYTYTLFTPGWCAEANRSTEPYRTM